MSPWTVNVQVPVNGRAPSKAIVERRHDGKLIHQDKRDVQVAKERRTLACELADLTGGAAGADDLEKQILAEWDREMRDHENKGEQQAGKRPSQADALVELAGAAKLFHTPGDHDSEGFATVEVNGHAGSPPANCTPTVTRSCSMPRARSCSTASRTLRSERTCWTGRFA